MQTRSLFEKLGDSVAGLRDGWRDDRAVRNQLILSAVGLVALAIAQPPLAWVLASVVMLVVGLATELMNGAVEALLDRLHPEMHPEIGSAKDLASAAAFVTNAAAAAITVAAVIAGFAG